MRCRGAGAPAALGRQHAPLRLGQGWGCRRAPERRMAKDSSRLGRSNGRAPGGAGRSALPGLLAEFAARPVPAPTAPPPFLEAWAKKKTSRRAAGRRPRRRSRGARRALRRDAPAAAPRQPLGKRAAAHAPGAAAAAPPRRGRPVPCRRAPGGGPRRTGPWGGYPGVPGASSVRPRREHEFAPRGSGPVRCARPRAMARAAARATPLVAGALPQRRGGTRGARACRHRQARRRRRAGAGAPAVCHHARGPALPRLDVLPLRHWGAVVLRTAGSRAPDAPCAAAALGWGAGAGESGAAEGCILALPARRTGGSAGSIFRQGAALTRPGRSAAGCRAGALHPGRLWARGDAAGARATLLARRRRRARAASSPPPPAGRPHS
jgi:hypothetical protein